MSGPSVSRHRADLRHTRDALFKKRTKTQQFLGTRGHAAALDCRHLCTRIKFAINSGRKNASSLSQTRNFVGQDDD